MVNIKDFYFTLKKLFRKLLIKDEKQFKNEIATFIYQLSVKNE